VIRTASRPASLATIHHAWLGEGRVAVTDESGVTMTYEELDELASRFAARLATLGVANGDRIGILGGNTARWIAAFFGVLRIGAVAVPLSPRLPDALLRDISGDAELALAFTDADNAGRLDVQALDLGRDELPESGSVPPMDVEPHAVAIQLYTSGSTGRPKGALLSHRSQLFTLESWAAVATSRSMEKTLVAAPLFHKNGLGETKLGFWLGAEVVLQRRFDARAYLEAAAEHRCSTLSGVPTMFALMMAEVDLLQRLDLSCVRGLEIGSAPLTEALLERVRDVFPAATIYNSYGTTEVAAIFGDAHPAGARPPRTSVGYPLETVDVRLVGDDGSDANPGELWVRCEGVMNGYHRSPELTREKIVHGWCRTGDVMLRDDDGWFHYVGRTDDMFSCGGENVYPGAVEQVLERHPAVRQAAVVPVPDTVKGEVPVAFIVPEPGRALTELELQRWSLDRVPAFQHPRSVWFFDELPLSGTEKVDRQALSELARHRRRP
jgi:acyl-CoA synthetase (AMP-forming)/AMP-acid ligase II